MTSLYIEIPNELYDQLKAHLEDSHDDLYHLISQAIAQRLTIAQTWDEEGAC